jgi:hypothetical protein
MRPAEDLQAEPDVLAYVRAAVAHAARKVKARCGTGHSTCTRAHLGIGPQCDAGQCAVVDEDAYQAPVEVSRHG